MEWTPPDAMKRTQKALKKLHESGLDLRTPLKQLGVYMLKSTDETFRLQGERPGMTRWKPPAPMTIAIREWSRRGMPQSKAAGGAGPMALMVTGALRESITFEVQHTALFWGTTDPRAKILHNGGWQPAPKRWKKRRRVYVPARPFINFLPPDEKVALRIIGDYMEGRGKEFGKR